MNKKIKQYSALALATASILPMSCSKDKESNDVNIDDKTVNKVLNAVLISGTEFGKEDSIDVNSDGQFDFDLAVGTETYSSNTYGYSFIDGKVAGNQILSNNQTISSYTLPIVTTKNSGDKINSSSSNWENNSYVGYKYNSAQVGIAGGGDKLIGFRFKAGANTHYGWMKVNLSSDYKTLTIKELAYNKTPDAEIAAGAK